MSTIVSPEAESIQTSMTSEALNLLHNQINRDVDPFDDLSKFRLQKLANAAEKAFAERTLLLDMNRLLLEQDNESRSRMSTKSTVIDKAKVMSYEDIVEAQKKRDAKEAKPKGGTQCSGTKKSTNI